VLENGLVVLSGEMKGMGLVCVHIGVLAGSALEGEHLGSGISHLVEHMLFKGTTRRPVGQIEKEIKSYGAFLNGATSLDTSSYQVTTPPQRLPEVLKILKDMMENASFSEDELKREKEVVAHEIRLNRDNPAQEARRLLWETSYLAHPYRYPVTGYEDLLAALTREDLRRYYERTYIPRRMVIAIVGDIDASVATDLATAVFGDFKRGGCPSTAASFESPQLAARRLERPFPTALAHHAFGFHSTGMTHPDMYAMDVLSVVLGQGNNSRLNDVLLKRERVVYAVSSYNYTPRDPGLFIINAVSSAETSDRVRPAVMKEIPRLRIGPVRGHGEQDHDGGGEIPPALAEPPPREIRRGTRQARQSDRRRQQEAERELHEGHEGEAVPEEFRGRVRAENRDGCHGQKSGGRLPRAVPLAARCEPE